MDLMAARMGQLDHLSTSLTQLTDQPLSYLGRDHQIPIPIGDDH